MSNYDSLVNLLSTRDNCKTLCSLHFPHMYPTQQLWNKVCVSSVQLSIHGDCDVDCFAIYPRSICLPHLPLFPNISLLLVTKYTELPRSWRHWLPAMSTAHAPWRQAIQSRKQGLSGRHFSPPDLHQHTGRGRPYVKLVTVPDRMKDRGQRAFFSLSLLGGH